MRLLWNSLKPEAQKQDWTVAMIITIKIEKGRTIETKRRAAAAFTQAAIDTLGAKPEWVNVLFEDYTKENWAIDGKLQLDRHGPEPVTLGNKD